MLFSILFYPRWTNLSNLSKGFGLWTLLDTQITCNIRIKSFKCLSFSNKPFDISLDLTKRVTFLSLFLEIIYDELGFNTV